MTLRTKVSRSALLVLVTALSYADYRQFMAATGHAASSIQPAGAVTAAHPANAISTTPPGSDLDMVRNGRLPEYSTRTVGSAFEARFEAPQWISIVTMQGQKAVEFRGTIRYLVLRQAGFYIGTWNGVQQGIDADKLISDEKHRCFAEAGKTETPVSDEAIVGPCMARAYQRIVVPVSFQFMMSADQKTVEMTLPDPVFQKFGPDHRLRAYRAATLAFIYQ